MKRIPLRRRLFLVVAAALVPLAIMSSVALYAGYREQRRQVERAGLDIARAFSVTVEAELRRTVSVLDVLGSSLEGPADLATFPARARLVATGQPNWNAIVLTDASAQVLAHTAVAPGEPLPAIVERESLAEVIASGVARVGFLARGPRGRYAIPVRVPVVRDGVVRYTLTAVLDPEAVLAVLNRQRIPGDWVVAVADAKGLRVARTRSASESIVTPYSPSLVQMMAGGEGEGTGITYSSEGDAVFTAFTRATPTGWTTAVGLPTAQVDAVARQSLLALGVGILMSIVVGLLAALFLARRVSTPMAQLREAAVGTRRGVPFSPPQTDILEIHDVATTLAAVSAEQAGARAEREELLRREQDARAAAEAANRAKDEFLAMLGHELRNPLGAISNAATVLESGRLDGESAGRARAVIGRQVAHLTRLMDDLLDAGRALLGKIVLQPQALDLAALVRQSIATLNATQRLREHRVVEDLESAWVRADPIRIDQVVANLVVNAVKYTPAGGAVRVSVRREGGEAVLRVADDGIGLSPELAARVFELFVQGDRDLDRSQGGLGIGLTLVRRLAVLHGGSATVESAGEGRGSEFTVRLPAIEPGAPAPQSPAGAPQARARDILVIEDNRDARETLQVMLELAGHRVRTAAEGLSGIDQAMADPPEVALIDVGLPGIDGYEVARRLRALGGRRSYLVALTGYGAPEDRRRALEAGFDEHVVKPVAPAALAALLATAEPGGTAT